MKYRLLSALLITIVIFSCTTAVIPLDEEAGPIEETITYNTDVKLIMDNHCTTCHGNVNPNAGLSLTNYTQVRSSAENGNLISRMNNQTNPMPPSGILSSQVRAVIDKWRDDGFLEN